MIEKISCLPQFPMSGSVSVRIRSLFNAYGGTLLRLYAQSQGDEITALMAVLGSGCTLAVNSDADFAELRSFLAFLGVEVFCGSEVFEELGVEECEKAVLLRWQGDALSTLEEASVKTSSIYDLLKNGDDGDIELPCFDEWYADYCIRRNHKSAEHFAINGAVAVAGFVTEDEALITGVAVEKTQRKKGLGTAVLHGLVAKLHEQGLKNDIFVCAKRNKALFYEKAGFEAIGQVAVKKLRCKDVF